MLWLIASGKPEWVPAGFAANGYGDLRPGKYSLTAYIVTEVVMTFFFLFIIVGTTFKGAYFGFAGSQLPWRSRSSISCRFRSPTHRSIRHVALTLPCSPEASIKVSFGYAGWVRSRVRCRLAPYHDGCMSLTYLTRPLWRRSDVRPGFSSSPGRKAITTKRPATPARESMLAGAFHHSFGP